MARRTVLVVLLMLLTAGTAVAAMSGTYYIKKDVSHGDTFPSLVAAGNALHSQGMEGNCTFLTFAGIYDEGTCSLESIPGADTCVTTFDKAPGQGEVMVADSSCCFWVNWSDNVKIRNYTLRASSYGVRSRYSNGMKVEGCLIRGPEYGCWTPIYVTYGNYDTVAGNYCHGNGGGYGMYIYGSSSSPSQGFVIANNMLDNNYYGMYIYSTNGCRVLYNSTQPAASGQIGLYLYSNHAMEIRDNIICANSYPIYSYQSDGTENYNDLWVDSSRHAVIDDHSYDAMDLAACGSASGTDSGSISADPEFVSESDCHLQPTSPCINAGDAIAGFLYDIDGDSRRANTPDMGADEWMPVAIDDGIARIEPDVTVLPNPQTGDFVVLRYGLSRAGTVQASVYSVTGQMVMTQSFTAERTGSMSLNLRQLSNGVYLVRFSSEGFESSQKLVVHKR